MNGLELLTALRANRPDGLPAIVLTGDISGETVNNIASQDCVQLSKPVKARDLSAAIERLCPLSAPLAPPSDRADAATSALIAYVVDDDPEIRSTIRDVLESNGRVVQDFASAEAFLAAYHASGAGCLLLDAHLPG